ncbi:MAG: hypothetical protein COS47_00250 [Candidatus Nealsonbacteria bacterium CG03_land_8_20_14_0_80_36_12]|uniref:Uncharacterized protein n=1 Tax=Candidatus Nealsonbacteria bacterium CG03_land_8_20_14_0_80_36_12 TaxID=1974701 RepID=A0A2M7BYV7_9BACT|nr:MAG: hypothetical protein COS47_00250 [Candidatus Nealsonbacteria bacterium CG03_land_8_20_14_0_80_36_12]
MRFFQGFERNLAILPWVRPKHSAFVQIEFFVPPATSFPKGVLLFLDDRFLVQCLALNSRLKAAGV